MNARINSSAIEAGIFSLPNFDDLQEEDLISEAIPLSHMMSIQTKSSDWKGTRVTLMR